MPKRQFHTHPICLLPVLFLAAGCGSNPVDPGGFVGKTGGCGNFTVYRFNAAMTDALVVRATASNLGFGREPVGFTLPNSDLDVRIERFSGAADQYYCDDVFGSGEPKVTHIWRAVSGTITVAAGDTTYVDPGGFMTQYKVSLEFRDVTLRDDDGNEVTIGNADLSDIGVGWLPG